MNKVMLLLALTFLSAIGHADCVPIQKRDLTLINPRQLTMNTLDFYNQNVMPSYRIFQLKVLLRGVNVYQAPVAAPARAEKIRLEAIAKGKMVFLNSASTDDLEEQSSFGNFGIASENIKDICN